MKAPKQEECCECCGAPIPPLKWHGVATHGWGVTCAYCAEPIPVDLLRWAPEDAHRILSETSALARYVNHAEGYGFGIIRVNGVRVSHV